MNMPEILISIAVAIGAGLLLTRLAKLIHLPDVTAYLVAGLIIGPHISGLLTEGVTEALSVFTTVALGFIAYSIGAEFRLSYLKQIGVRPIIVTLFQAFAAAGLVIGVLVILGVDLPLALTLGAIATATAPAATLMVVRQYKADGPVSRMLLPVVAMDDVVGLIMFSICSSIAVAISSGESITISSMLLNPLKEIGLSIALGAALGGLLTVAAIFFRSKAKRLALSIMCVLAAVGLCEMFALSSLLVCMMIGAVMINTSRNGDALMDQADGFTPPLFLIFFVLSGAELDISVIPTVGVIGVAYILARSVGKWLGTYAGASLVRTDKNVRHYLGLALLPQAGVAIGMAQMCMNLLPDYSSQINAVVLSATLIYELFGPVITKIALTKAGEIHAEKAPKRRALAKK